MFIFFNYNHRKKLKQAINVSKKINSGYFPYPSAIFNYLRKIDPFVFEELLLYTFKKRGYKVYRNKRYQSYVNFQHLVEFDNLCNRCNTYGFFIHTGKTGSESKKVNKNIQIVSGDYLLKFLKYKE